MGSLAVNKMDNSEGRSKRSIGKKKEGRLAALEKLKAIKEGRLSKYEIEEEESLYDEVNEDEYNRIAQERAEDDWIVDDDGGGYAEDGRDIFDDDNDDEGYDGKDKKKNKEKKNKINPNIRPHGSKPSNIQ